MKKIYVGKHTFFLYIYINMCSKQLGCSFKNNQMIKILKLWKYFNTIKTSRIWLDQTMQFQYTHLSKNAYCTKNQIGAWVVVIIIIPKGALFAVVRVKITPQTCNQRDTKEWKEKKKKKRVHIWQINFKQILQWQVINCMCG